MKATRRKNIHQWEQQPKKKRSKKMKSKKMKISVIQRKSSAKEEEGTSANSDYFNKLSTDVITSLLLRCTLKSLSMLRLRFVSVDMDGSKEELYTVTFPDTQLACATMRVCFRGIEQLLVSMN